jgi:STE24 endopeptidase
MLIVLMLLPALREVIGEPSLLTRLSGGQIAMITVGTIAFVWAICQLLVWRCGREIDRTGHAWQAGRADRFCGLARVLIVLAMGLAMLALGWLDIVRGVIGDLIVIDELLALLPALVALVMTWWSFFPIDRRFREASLLRELDRGHTINAMPSRWGYALMMARQTMTLSCVPLLVMLTWREAVSTGLLWAWWWDWVSTELARVLEPALQLGGAIGILVLLPPIIRRVWDTVPLAPGPMRDELEALCRSHDVRVREILVWRTGGLMLNGAVMGLVPRLRYILLTDALLDALGPRQIHAVMAHEVGHVRLRHMPWMWGACLGTLMLTGAGVESFVRWKPEWMPTSPWDELSAGLFSIGLTLLVFGWISRRFEWQADAFAVKHLSGVTWLEPEPRPATPEAIGAMVGALQSVAMLNNIPRERFNWRHGSIADRQRRLRGLQALRTDQFSIDRISRVWKWAIGLGLLASLGLAALAGVM